MQRCARVIIVLGGGHTFAGFLGAECVKGIAARFLETADPKSLDVACVADIRRQPFVVKFDGG